MSDDTAAADTSRRRFLQYAGSASAVCLAGCGDDATPNDLLALSHGVAVGDVTNQSAVFWGRAEAPGSIHVEYGPDESLDDAKRSSARVDGESDFVGKLRLDGLQSGTRYHYRAWGTSGTETSSGRAPENASETDRGTFRTAPDANEDAAVTVAWSGDTYGYGGAPVEPPYPGLEAIAEMQPDFFLYLGDTIYADASTPAGKVTAATDPDDALEVYYDKYKEMRVPSEEVADRTHLQKLLAATSVYAMWDDHEVVNNFHRNTDLMPVGRQAFHQYWPIDSHDSVTGTSPHRLYRSFQWGNHLELFIIDTRQYREPGGATGADKTMLGDEQLTWLKDGLGSSDATFKVIASSTTMGIRSGDGWTQSGTGYEAELDDLFEFVASEGVDNVIVASGDIHKAQVASFDTNGDYVTEFVEASAGPLGAPGNDPNEYHEPYDPNPYFERGNDFYNFGVLEVDEQGEHIWIEIRHETGKIAFSRKFDAV